MNDDTAATRGPSRHEAEDGKAAGTRPEESLAEDARTRGALLFLLEDLEENRLAIEQAHREWMYSVDAVRDPIMVHDKDFRVVRANRAYAERAGMEIRDLIGRLYWECFPKRSGPLPGCDKAVSEAHPGDTVPVEEFVLEGGEVYISRAFVTQALAGGRAYSLHLFENVTERRRAEHEQQDRLRRMQAHSIALEAISSSEALLAGDVDLIAREMTEHAARAAEVERASVWLFSQDETELRCIDSYQVSEARHCAGALLKQEQVEDAFRSLLVAPYVDADDALNDPRSRGYAEMYLKPLGITSLLDSVVELSGKHVGVLCLEHVGKLRHWERDEISFAGRLADKIALAITNRARRQAQEALERRERYFRKLIEGSSDAFFVVDRAGKLVYRSESGKRMTGWDNEDVMGKDITTYVSPESLSLTRRAITNAIREPDKPSRVELRMLCKDGSILDAEAVGRNLLDDPDICGIVVTAHDVTERKLAEAVRTQLAALVASSHDAIFGIGLDGIVTSWNPGAETVFGYRADEIVGKSADILKAPERRGDARSLRRQALYGKEVSGVEEPRIHKDGRQIDVSFTVSPLRDTAGAITGVSVTGRDVTERKKAERALNRANRALRTLSAGNEALVRAVDEPALLAEMCRVIVEVGGYRVSVANCAEDDEAQSVKSMACRGIDIARVADLRLCWTDGGHEQGVACKAIRSGVPQVVQGTAADIGYDPWIAPMIEQGVTSAIVLPLRADAADWPFGVLCIGSTDADAFHEEEVKLLTELAGDLAFGIATLRMRTARREAGERLRKSLQDSIQVIASTVEMRDPYTAGHQRRVASLAAAIGHEMGLPEERVHGLQLAGSIHDLGKIGVPSEYLSKPSRLNDIEMSLIKAHAQAGHDILKDVDFPWPIADIILQHHERLDGSGYPHGLKGAQILLESRIVSVADVVEAMSSHRPYRPSLGLEAALAEIERGSGSAYDPVVVEACLKLFREGRFSFQA